MPKDKDRSGRNSENDRKQRQQRMWSPSHKTGRGGGNARIAQTARQEGVHGKQGLDRRDGCSAFPAGCTQRLGDSADPFGRLRRIEAHRVWQQDRLKLANFAAGSGAESVPQHGCDAAARVVCALPAQHRGEHQVATHRSVLRAGLQIRQSARQQSQSLHE